MIVVGKKAILETLSISKRTFKEWLSMGFPAVKIAGRWRLVEEDAERWLSAKAAEDVARRRTGNAPSTQTAGHLQSDVVD